MTSYVTAGRGKGIVIATGMNTEVGRIASLIREAPEEETPLQKRLSDLETIEYSYDRAVRFIICPRRLAEARRDGNAAHCDFPGGSCRAGGLPTTVTIVLALGVTKMARAGTIVRRLPSVETLGQSAWSAQIKRGR